MNTDSVALAAESAKSRSVGSIREDRVWRAVALIASLAFGIGWTLLLGKAFHWDAINYHFYLGFAALNDRFALDFFAAGTPSYINPYAYVPLHLMDRAEVPSMIAAIAIAAFHSLILWLTFELALVLGPACPGRERHPFAMLALVLSAMGPVLLQGLGLTLVDIPIGAFVVGGWLALGIALRQGALGWVACGAILGGIAAGLKLSNGLYAAAALSMMVVFPGDWRRKLQASALYGAACGLAFVAVAAPWSWELWRTFGNPLFPFLNDLFASPDFTSEALHYERFRPTGLRDILARPFHMLSPLSLQHTEGRAPDLRFAALFVALVVTAGMSHWRAPRGFGSACARTPPEAADTRVVFAFAVAFVVAWCLWLTASGNSRYFIPIGCVASALFAALLQRAYRRWKDGTLVVIALVLLGQVVQFAIAADWKRDGVAWGGPLLRAQFPERYRAQPYLFLSASFMSASAFLPRWHPKSGMMTIAGFYAIGPERPGWERARRMIDANKNRLRIISALPKEFDETTGLPGATTEFNVVVRRFGLEVDPADCDFVKLQSNLQHMPRDEERHRWTTWISCALRESSGAATRYLEDMRPIEVVFDRVESVCPNLFHPPRPVTEQLPRWTRRYNMGSEIQLWIDAGRVLYFSPLVGGDPIDVGSVTAWLQGPQPIDCSRKSGPAFNGLLE